MEKFWVYFRILCIQMHKKHMRNSVWQITCVLSLFPLLRRAFEDSVVLLYFISRCSSLSLAHRGRCRASRRKGGHKISQIYNTWELLCTQSRLLRTWKVFCRLRTLCNSPFVNALRPWKRSRPFRAGHHRLSDEVHVKDVDVFTH